MQDRGCVTPSRVDSYTPRSAMSGLEVLCRSCPRTIPLANGENTATGGEVSRYRTGGGLRRCLFPSKGSKRGKKGARQLGCKKPPRSSTGKGMEMAITIPQPRLPRGQTLEAAGTSRVCRQSGTGSGASPRGNGSGLLSQCPAPYRIASASLPDAGTLHINLDPAQTFSSAFLYILIISRFFPPPLYEGCALLSAAQQRKF